MTRSLRFFLCTIAAIYCISPARAQTLVGPIALAPVAIESDSPLAAVRWALDAVAIAGTHDTMAPAALLDADENANEPATEKVADNLDTADAPIARIADASVEPADMTAEVAEPELALVETPVADANPSVGAIDDVPSVTGAEGQIAAVESDAAENKNAVETATSEKVADNLDTADAPIARIADASVEPADMTAEVAEPELALVETPVADANPSVGAIDDVPSVTGAEGQIAAVESDAAENKNAVETATSEKVADNLDTADAPIAQLADANAETADATADVVEAELDLVESPAPDANPSVGAIDDVPSVTGAEGQIAAVESDAAENKNAVETATSEKVADNLDTADAPIAQLADANAETADATADVVEAELDLVESPAPDAQPSVTAVADVPKVTGAEDQIATVESDAAEDVNAVETATSEKVADNLDAPIALVADASDEPADETAEAAEPELALVDPPAGDADPSVVAVENVPSATGTEDKIAAIATDAFADVLEEEYLPYDVEQHPVVRINVFPAEVRAPKTFVMLLPTQQGPVQETVDEELVADRDDTSTCSEYWLASDQPVSEDGSDLVEGSINAEVAKAESDQLATDLPASEDVKPSEYLATVANDRALERQAVPDAVESPVETVEMDAAEIASTAIEMIEDLCGYLETEADKIDESAPVDEVETNVSAEEAIVVEEVPAVPATIAAEVAVEAELADVAEMSLVAVAEDLAVDADEMDSDEAAAMAADLALIEELFGPESAEPDLANLDGTEQDLFADEQASEEVPNAETADLNLADADRYAAFEAMFGPSPEDDAENQIEDDLEAEESIEVAEDAVGVAADSQPKSTRSPAEAVATNVDEADPWEGLFDTFVEQTTPSEVAAVGPPEDLGLEIAVDRSADEGILLPIDPDALGKRIVEGFIEASELLRSLAQPVTATEAAIEDSITSVDEEAPADAESVCTPVAPSDVIASIATDEDADVAEAEIAAVESETEQR